MTYITTIPKYPLSRFIECLWFADLRMWYPREKILPSATIELMINFGAPFRLYDGDDKPTYTQHTESWLAGLQTVPLYNEPVAETLLLGVRFKPGGLYPFLTVSAHELHNQVVSLEALWGRRFAAELRERLYEAGTTSARFRLMEETLLSKLQHPHTDLKLIEFAVTQLACSNGMISISHLSDHIGISSKHLITLFKRVVGVTPKTLARVYRFQQVLNAINPADSVNWTAIALEAHYYDQAHFNHDFVSFTGMSPGEYLQRRLNVYGNIQQGQDVHFVPIG